MSMLVNCLWPIVPVAIALVSGTQEDMFLVLTDYNSTLRGPNGI